MKCMHAHLFKANIEKEMFAITNLMMCICENIIVVNFVIVQEILASIYRQNKETISNEGYMYVGDNTHPRYLD